MVMAMSLATTAAVAQTHTPQRAHHRRAGGGPEMERLLPGDPGRAGWARGPDAGWGHAAGAGGAVEPLLPRHSSGTGGAQGPHAGRGALLRPDEGDRPTAARRTDRGARLARDHPRGADCARRRACCARRQVLGWRGTGQARRL